MTVLNMTTHDSVLGVTDYLEKLKDAAVAYGWTLHNFETNVQWAFGGFIAGNESFLQISTTGYGGQSIFVRIRTQVDAGDALSDNLIVGMHKTSTFSTSTSTHPVTQGNWNTGSDAPTSYSPTDIPMLWIFGNERTLFTVAQHNNTQVVFQLFGTLEQFDETMTEGEFCCTSGTGVTKWYTGNQEFPLDTVLEVYYDAQLKSSQVSSNVTRSFTATNNLVTNGFFGHAAESLEGTNSFSERRALERQIIAVKDTDSQYFDHGQCWIYRCHAQDLAIGTVLIFGTRKFVVFPNADSSASSIGVAVEVA